MKTEFWNGYKIRFILKGDDWWAVATDITKALGLKQVTRALKSLNKDGVTISKGIDNLGREQNINIVDEKSIYKLIFKSRKKEAIDFQDWIFGIIKDLRKSAGLEGFEVFRMLDKKHQKAAMHKLYESLSNPIKVDFIKANIIASKAVSTIYGHPKMLKKEHMTAQMLKDREPILDDVVNLMAANESFNLGLSISNSVYEKYTH